MFRRIKTTLREADLTEAKKLGRRGLSTLGNTRIGQKIREAAETDTGQQAVDAARLVGGLLRDRIAESLGVELALPNPREETDPKPRTPPPSAPTPNAAPPAGVISDVPPRPAPKTANQARTSSVPPTGVVTQKRPAARREPIRTRTMARLLAEQGHHRRAVRIYKELISAAGDAERDSLQAELKELKERAQEERAASTDDTATA